MNHLNSQQISEWLIGERAAGIAAHIEQCEACRAEIAQMESGLAVFRKSVHGWSERQPIHRAVWSTPAGWLTFRNGLRWAAATALFLLLLGAPAYRMHQLKLQAEERAREDAALLEAIDAGISRSVPQPLQPLDNLVAWNPATEGSKQ